jgi:cold-inducible RNA-binding protein
MSHKIYVGNLSFRSDETSLRNHFAGCGEITEVHIVLDRATGRSKGFSFVTFADESAVEAAIKLSGQELDGRPLRIDRATGESRAPRTGGGGFGGGNGGGFGGGNNGAGRPPRRY